MKYLFLWLGCFYSLVSWAQPGSDCANAIPISLPFASNTFSTCNSQNNFEAPSPGDCFYPSESVNQYASGRDLFFYFVPEVSACYNMIPYTNNVGLNPSLFVYEGCPAEFNCLAGSVFYLDGLPLLAGHTYVIVVSNRYDPPGTDCIDFQLYISDPDQVLPNDLCSGIATMTGSANNFNASSCGEPDDWAPELQGIDCPGGDWTSNENAMWYAFTNPTTQDVSFTIYNINCTGINGNDNSLQIGVWANDQTCALSLANFISCEVATGTTTVQLPNLAAGDYYLFVDGNAGSLCSWNFYSPDLCIPPTIELSSVAPACNDNNGAVQLSLNPNTPPNGDTYSLLWSNGSSNTANLNNLPAGTYTVTLTQSGNNGSCTTTASVTLPDTDLSASISTQLPNCIGEPVTLTASGGVGYTWQGSGITPSAQNHPQQTITPAIGGINAYTVTITDAQGCTTTATTTIPTVSFGVQFDTPPYTCAGQPLLITVSGGSSYAWQAPNGTITSVSNELNIPALSTADAGIYTVTVTGVAGCTLLATTQVVVDEVLAAIVAPATFCINDTLQLAAVDGAASYQWSGPFGFNSTQQNPSIYPTNQFGAGNYTLTVSSANGCTATATQNITLSSVNATAENNSPTCAPNAVQLHAAGGVSYVWANAATWVANEPDPILSNTNAAQSGTYTVTVTNADACTSTASTQVTINGINATITAPQSVCVGQTVSLNATGGANYNWAGVAGFGASGATAVVPNAATWQAGDYTVTVTAANGCATILTTSVAVNEAQTDLNIYPNNACPNDTVLLVAAGNGVSYQWQLPNGSIFTYNNDTLTLNTVGSAQVGAYAVTVTDANGCTASDNSVLNVANLSPAATVGSPICANQTLSFVASGGVSYSWAKQASNTIVANTPNFSLPNAAVTDGGVYVVTVTAANGCTATASTTAVVNEAQVSASVALPLCHLNDVQLSVSGALTYVWNGVGGFVSNVPNPLIAAATAANNGIYTVQATDANGCTTSASVQVLVPLPLTLSASSQAVSCWGYANGTASSIANGGTLPYSWAWSNGDTTNTIGQLTANTYALSVTDANGCTATAQTTVTQPDTLQTTLNTQPPPCFGSLGQISSQTQGGTLPYAYLWSDSANNDLSLSIGAGSYTLTVTDANACTATAQANLNEPPLLTIDEVSINDALCFGTASGSIGVSVGGGTAVYQYTWSNTANNTANIGNLPADTYTLTVTDANACTATQSYTIAQPTPLLLQLYTDTIACFGGTAGVYSTAQGGIANTYAYQWSNGNNTSQIDAALAASYTLTVTDVNGCSITQSINLVQPPILQSSVQTLSPTCYDSANGAAEASSSGGTMPYSYAWSSLIADTTFFANNLVAGNYALTVTDANNCTVALSFNIAAPDTLTISASSTAAPCANTNGTLNASVSGGNGGYVYTWSNGASTANTLAAAGDYTLTVTDALGCSASAQVGVSQPNPLTVSLVASPTICYNTATATLEATATGGILPYSYLWSGGLPSLPTHTASVAAGSYTLTLTDANNCTATANITVTDAPEIVLQTTTTPANCNQSDGSASVLVQSPTNVVYNYAWQNGVSTATCIGLGAGTYTVTVTNSEACSQTISALVNNNNAPQINNVLLTNAWCNLANGSVSISATVASGEPTYQWSANAGGATTASLQNIAAGNYLVTVTDAASCSTLASFVIANTPPPTISWAAINPATCNLDNGSLWANVVYYTPTAQIAWSNGATDTTQLAHLTPNTYTVTVTDQLGCSATASANIPQLGSIAAWIAVVAPASCGVANGGLSAAVSSNAVSPISYAWSNGGNTAGMSSLAAATYTVTVTDANQCSATASVELAALPPPQLSWDSVQQPTCEQANGSVGVMLTGGSSPFSYNWSNGVTDTNYMSQLSAGNYSLTVTDALGCVANIDTVLANQASPIISHMIVTDEYCAAQNGSVQIVLSSATNAPLEYVWTDNASQTDLLSDISAGDYSVTVTDIHACTATAVVTVGSLLLPSVAIGAVQNADCGAANGAVIAVANGLAPLNYYWSSGGGMATETNLLAGNYTITVSDALGCTATATAVVGNPNAPIITAFATQNETCNATNGSLSITASDAAGGELSYAWNNGATTAQQSGITAGSYTVTVSNAAQCSTIATLTVANESAPQLGVDSVQAALCGNNNGYMSTTVTGGTGVLAYSWANTNGVLAGANSYDLASLTNDTYTVTVTDQNNCTASMSASLSAAPPPLISSIGSTPTTCGNANGTATIGITGGSGGEWYVWTNGVSGGATADNLAAGDYTLTVTDSNGCSTTASVSVGAIPLPLITDVVLTAATCNANNASIEINTSADAPLTYAWSNGSTAHPLTALASGTYTVTITDAHNCTLSTQAVVPLLPTVAIQQVSTTTAWCGNANGSATVTLLNTSELGLVTYTWSGSTATDSIASGLMAGVYTVTVTDANNCTATATATVAHTNGVQISEIGYDLPTCGQDNGLAWVTATNYTGDLSYAWSNGTTDSVTTHLVAATYAVTITDAQGCTDTASVIINDLPYLPNIICLSSTDTTISIQWTPLPNTNAYIVSANGITDTLPPTTNTYTISTTADTTVMFAVATLECGLANAASIACSSLPNTDCPSINPLCTIADTVVCSHAPAVLLSAAPAGGVWTGVGVTDAYFVPQNAGVGTHPITYTYTVNDTCTYIATQNMMVLAAPNPYIAGDTAVCLSASYLFTAQPASSEPMSYTWWLDNEVQANGEQWWLYIDDTSATTIQLVATNAAGCSDTAQLLLQPSYLHVQTIADTTVLQHSLVALPASVWTNAPNGVQYQWLSDGGTLHCYDCSAPIAQPLADSSWYVVMASNSYGCSDTDSVSIRLRYKNVVLIPNAFSPNSDALNEQLGLLGKNIAHYTLAIHNRWGQEVYSYAGSNPAAAWDGTFNSQHCEVGVYVYYANVRFDDGQTTFLKGNITLIR